MCFLESVPVLRHLWERPFCGTEWESKGFQCANWVTAQAGVSVAALTTGRGGEAGVIGVLLAFLLCKADAV